MRSGPYLTIPLSHVRSFLLVQVVNSAVIHSMPVMASVAAFLIFSSLGNQLASSVVFSSVTYFELLHLPLTILR